MMGMNFSVVLGGLQLGHWRPLAHRGACVVGGGGGGGGVQLGHWRPLAHLGAGVTVGGK